MLLILYEEWGKPANLEEWGKPANLSMSIIGGLGPLVGLCFVVDDPPVPGLVLSKLIRPSVQLGTRRLEFLN